MSQVLSPSANARLSVFNSAAQRRGEGRGGTAKYRRQARQAATAVPQVLHMFRGYKRRRQGAQNTKALSSALPAARARRITGRGPPAACARSSTGPPAGRGRRTRPATSTEHRARHAAKCARRRQGDIMQLHACCQLARPAPRPSPPPTTAEPPLTRMLRNQSCEASRWHTMGAGHCDMEIMTASPGRSSCRLRPSKLQ